jgi:hypothetical protein
VRRGPLLANRAGAIFVASRIMDARACAAAARNAVTIAVARGNDSSFLFDFTQLSGRRKTIHKPLDSWVVVSDLIGDLEAPLPLSELGAIIVFVT